MRDWKLTLLIVCCSLFCYATLPAASAEDSSSVIFYVSPRGKDSSSGKLAEPKGDDGPFATLSRARDAVREVRKRLDESGGVRVVLRAGTYHLGAPLDLGPEDSGADGSPVIYAAAPGERVVL